MGELLPTARFSDRRQDAIAIIKCSEGDDLKGVWHSPVVVVVSVILQDVLLQYPCMVFHYLCVCVFNKHDSIPGDEIQNEARS